MIHGSESFLFVVGLVQPLSSSCVKQDVLALVGTVNTTADHVLQHFYFFLKLLQFAIMFTKKQTKPSLNPSIRTSAHTFIITVRICVCDFTDRNASRTNEDETLVTGTNRILSDSRTEMA